MRGECNSGVVMQSLTPSQHELIANLSVLDRLLFEKTSSAKLSKVQRETEQLPYYLRGACAAICQFELARIEAVKVLSAPSSGPNSRVVLATDKVDPLAFAVDFYLFCMRRALDALIPYLSRCPDNISLPSSLNALVNGLGNRKYQSLDLEIRTTILSFWGDIGKKIKGYRDQANHKAIILSNCIAFNGEGGCSGLRMLLPDNPDEKRPSEIKYDPGVPAMGFALDALEKSLLFVNMLVERMIDLMCADNPEARRKGVVSIAMRGAPLKIGAKFSGEPVP